MKKLTRCTLALFLSLLFLLAPISQVCADGLPFVDVKVNSWYEEAVRWAYENGIVSGIDATHFGPNKPCTRAQIVTILYGLAGKPEPEIENPFDDVSPKNYYYNAVLWALEQGITGGVSDHEFGPNRQCTRAQAVTFIWAYFGREILAPEVRFDDVPQSAYYYDAVNWAFGNGVTAGTEWNRFSPKATVTRAMVVVFLYAQRHVLEGGTHDFQYVEDVAASCTAPAGRLYQCACGNKKTVYDAGSAPLGHDFCQAKLISDATATAATVYQLTCIRCGKADSAGNRSLGKPIFAEPMIQSKYRTHFWTQDELKNGIRITSGDGAEAVITRKWFANAWCYITHIILPAGSWSHYTGTNIYALYGSNDPAKYTSGYKMLQKLTDAKILFAGDIRLLNNGATLRGGVPYQTKIFASATYWNPREGTYGQILDMGYGGNVPFTTLMDLGITDTYSFGVPNIKESRMDMELFNSEADYDEASYTAKDNRRQISGIGFKREGDTIHIYHVAADGCCYTNTGAANPYNFANDRASYGNTKRELAILMSTLGVEYSTNLDGGWSVCLNIRYNGVVEQVNAADFSLKTGYSAWDARELWDFVYFK